MNTTDEFDVRALPDQSPEPLGLALGQFLFQEHGEVERVLPAAADLLRILDDQD